MATAAASTESSPTDLARKAASLPWGGDRIQLQPGELVLATCRFDLDGHMRFSDGWIALTDRRLIADTPASADAAPTPEQQAAAGPRSWPLHSDTRLDVHLRAAVGRIELSEHGRVVARWLFTPAKAKGVHALEDAFDARLEQPAGPPASATTRSPAAEELSEPTAPPARSRADDDVPLPGGGLASWQALGRLLAFAKPHWRMAALGIVLSLTSTSAALVPRTSRRVQCMGTGTTRSARQLRSLSPCRSTSKAASPAASGSPAGRLARSTASRTASA